MKKNGKKAKAITELNFIFYVLLLIMTPFLLLQNYLQAAIGVASNSQLELGTFSIPWVVIVAFVILTVLLIMLRKVIRIYHIKVSIVLVLLYLLAQQVTDYYFGHKFYELQHNWHYIAYAGFAVVSWRFLKSKGKNPAQIIWYTMLLALSASTLDEFAQVPLSNRVFDVCDIAKDTYGAVVGNLFVYYLLNEGKELGGRLKLTHAKLSDYFKDAKTLLFYEFMYAFIFLCISSIISDSQYIVLAFLLPVVIFLMIWLYIHFLQFKLSRIILLGILLISVLSLGVSYSVNRNSDITYNDYGITVYKGIPLPFFDIMIYENGFFRFVDKKHIFTMRDQRTIKKKCSDILIIGSGEEGKGGRGFPENEEVQFVYNSNIGRMTQVIILRTPEACKVYNRLKKEGKNVTFIIHNTC